MKVVNRGRVLCLVAGVLAIAGIVAPQAADAAGLKAADFKLNQTTSRNADLSVEYGAMMMPSNPPVAVTAAKKTSGFRLAGTVVTVPDNSKSATHEVTVENETGWFVKVYLNGYYQFTAPRWGNTTIYCTPMSNVTWYARADFDDNTYRYWGPHTRNIDAPMFWKLTQ